MKIKLFILKFLYRLRSKIEDKELMLSHKWISKKWHDNFIFDKEQLIKGAVNEEILLKIESDLRLMPDNLEKFFLLRLLNKLKNQI